MLKILINSVNFNYENGEVKNVTVVYRAQTEDYQHNLSGNLVIDEADYQSSSDHDALVLIVKKFLIDLLKKEKVEDYDIPSND